MEDGEICVNVMQVVSTYHFLLHVGLRQLAEAAGRKNTQPLLLKGKLLRIEEKLLQKRLLKVFRPLGWPAGHLGGPPSCVYPIRLGCSHPSRKGTTTPVLIT